MTGIFSVKSVVPRVCTVLMYCDFPFVAKEYTVNTDGASTTYSIRAEVGLLSRNIKIEGAAYDNMLDESFGARVIVGKFYQDGVEYKGEYTGWLMADREHL